MTHFIFDMDGVLYPTTEQIQHAFLETTARFMVETGTGLSYIESLETAQKSLETYGSSREIFIRDYNLDGFSVMQSIHHRLPIEDLLSPDPVIVTALNSMQKQNMRLSILTSADRAFTERVLSALSIRSLFEDRRIITGDDYKGLTKSKNRTPFEITLSRCGEPAETSVMIEDSLPNLKIPCEMGFANTVLLYSQSLTHPDWVKETHATLADYLKKIVH